MRQLTADERAELVGVTLPVIVAGPGQLELDELLDTHKAFGATVLDGLVMGSQRVGRQTGIHLLGPGDLLPGGERGLAGMVGGPRVPCSRTGTVGADRQRPARRRPPLAADSPGAVRLSWRAATSPERPTGHLPAAAGRGPRPGHTLAPGRVLGPGDARRRPAAVDAHPRDGRRLVGARRPTVTLALRKLTDEGALVTQESGWLLLEPPALPVEAAHERSGFDPGAVAPTLGAGAGTGTGTGTRTRTRTGSESVCRAARHRAAAARAAPLGASAIAGAARADQYRSSPADRIPPADGEAPAHASTSSIIMITLEALRSPLPRGSNVTRH